MDTATAATTGAAAENGGRDATIATAAAKSVTTTSQLSAPAAESENGIQGKEDNEDELDDGTLHGALNALQATVDQDSVKYSAAKRVERRDALQRTLSASFRTSQHPRAIAINSREGSGRTAAAAGEGRVETAAPAIMHQETNADLSSSGDADRNGLLRRREWGSTRALGVIGKRLTLKDVGGAGRVLEGELADGYGEAATGGAGKTDGDEWSGVKSVQTLPSVKSLDEKSVSLVCSPIDVATVLSECWWFGRWSVRSLGVTGCAACRLRFGDDSE